jgi:hypothetical protein
VCLKNSAEDEKDRFWGTVQACFFVEKWGLLLKKGAPDWFQKMLFQSGKCFQTP